MIAFLHWALANAIAKGGFAEFPDPTDEAYLAEMPNDVSDKVALIVRSIIVDVGGVEPDEVWPSTPLTEILE